ncbi:hypothetical protein C8R45DRAFT_1100091 [Mycena sanguinolenta]|nr:hypothetical protein C8R45DRAFT_1100091 [Mycena sanguinolenta]
MDQLPHLQSVYVGMVEETGSLFAMSPDRFPLAVFSGGKRNKVKAIDPPADEAAVELPGDIDEITAERKRREKAMNERNYGSENDRCMDRSSLYSDRRCLVGIRPLEGGDGDGPEMRLKRLIDGVPSVPSLNRDPLENANRIMNGTVDGAGNTSTERREKAMKERNYGSEDNRSMDRSSLYSDRRCLVGIRPLEGGDGDGPEMRLKRLIDGVPSVPPAWEPVEKQ